MNSPVYHIEKLVHGGFGLSYDKDGMVVLIEGAIPGEEVRAKIRSQSKNLAQAVVTEVVTPSPGRIQPPCPYYQKCGGCDFQHISYPYQLQVKQSIVKDLLVRSGHPDLQKAAGTLLKVPLASPQQFHYRQRIRLQVDENQVLGFHKRRSHHCIAIDNCLLARDEINDCLQKLVPQRVFTRLLSQTEALEILYDPKSSNIHILIHCKRKPRPADKQHAQELVQSISEIQNIFFLGDGFGATGRDSLSVTLLPIPGHSSRPLSLSWETGGFCQVNLKQNINLIHTVLDFCRITEKETVLDLFCGMGNFSIPLAEQAGSVLGIEGQGSAIRSGRKNSTDAGQNNTEFLKRPIHQACETLVQENRTFDCVVIDPPRQGVPGLAGELASLCSKRMVYVSCDPATLCRDLADLLGQGFFLKKLQLIDMFPQTHHIETIALLEKR
ncbi:MAG: class I SAM-dependent RNA methyltransferase [Thermodesulfobacteriota bacterium]|nr:class I SAM-dependent RNA methyltransferase [Thermodesulfobacteriota bacterium]